MKTFTTSAAIDELKYNKGIVYYTTNHTIQCHITNKHNVIAIIKVKNIKS